eukprot:CAMPEP_0172699432 /NCGR_PEP_ID=MMETSP1074-20121228/30181_1 /TAXON_ID=2916 /ORGANISM="Ceratium fusus, Strain PA161109" /LENGTH=532 /DNA_ID=CAMNT_0013520633 /DNA_START=116 /DNA_END=1711 /DNA_ORIENTATION=+
MKGHLDPQTADVLAEKHRDHDRLGQKPHSKHERQRLLAYAYWDDRRQIEKSTDRRACRPWLAESFERLPALASDKRLHWQRQSCRQAIQARICLMQHLRATFGHEVRAWRQGLDREGHFAVDRTQLFCYCRQADLDVDLHALWRGMDQDGDGCFTLEEFDPQRALALAGLRSWCHKSFGSCAALWDQPEVRTAREQPQGSGRWCSSKKLLISEFLKVLRTLDCPGEAGSKGNTLLLSAALALDLYGCGFVSQADLRWLDSWKPPRYLLEAPEPGAWAELRGRMLEQHGGRPFEAWRTLLDRHSRNRVTWRQFMAACKRLRFRGDPGAAWRCLDKDVDGVICLRDFDKASAEVLGSFKSWADEKFGSVELAFKALDTNGSGTLTCTEFKQACSKLKWSGDVQPLLDCLGLGVGEEEHGKGNKLSLTVAGIAFLDSWAEHEPCMEAAVEAQAREEANQAKLRPKPAQPCTPLFCLHRNAKQCRACFVRSSSNSSRIVGKNIKQDSVQLGASSSEPELFRLQRTYGCDVLPAMNN